MATQQHPDQEYLVGEEIPATAALVRRAPTVVELASPEEVAAAIRQRDDQQILAQILGEAITEWFYEFRVQGKLVEGVSVTGAAEFARIRAEQGFPIRFPPGAIAVEELHQNGEPGIRVTVVARCARTGAEGVGMAFYPWYTTNRDGNRRLDDKADRKALSVAKRNAILDLIPEAQVRALLKARKELVERNEARIRTEIQQANRQAIASRKEARRVLAGGPQPIVVHEYGEQAAPASAQPAQAENAPSAPSAELALDDRKTKRNAQED